MGVWEGVIDFEDEEVSERDGEGEKEFEFKAEKFVIVLDWLGDGVLEEDKEIEGVREDVLDWEMVLVAEGKGVRVRESEGDFVAETLPDDDFDADLVGVKVGVGEVVGRLLADTVEV